MTNGSGPEHGTVKQPDSKDQVKPKGEDPAAKPAKPAR